MLPMFMYVCAALVACAGGASIIGSHCAPNTCMLVDCMMVTADTCQGGVVKKNGGYCGCCDACVTQLSIGDACTPHTFLGGPVTSECGRDSYCDPVTSTCRIAAAHGKRESGPCAQKLAEVDARLAASHGMLLGLERPHCDADGNYAGMQFAGSQAYCVTKNGTAISGYMVNRWETGPDMNCRCARDLYDYMATGLIGKLFHCEPNGNYAGTQCTGDVCYCVDQAGNKVGTTSVHVTQLGSLNC